MAGGWTDCEGNWRSKLDRKQLMKLDCAGAQAPQRVTERRTWPANGSTTWLKCRQNSSDARSRKKIEEH